MKNTLLNICVKYKVEFYASPVIKCHFGNQSSKMSQIWQIYLCKNWKVGVGAKLFAIYPFFLGVEFDIFAALRVASKLYSEQDSPHSQR